MIVHYTSPLPVFSKTNETDGALQNRSDPVTLATEFQTGGCPVNLRDLPYTIDDIFPPGGFAFHMRFRTRRYSRLSSPTQRTAPVLLPNGKKCWTPIPGNTQRFSSGESILDEVVETCGRPRHPCSHASHSQWKPASHSACLGTGTCYFFALWKMLSPELVGGCVCFPRPWSFEGENGRPLDAIHPRPHI